MFANTKQLKVYLPPVTSHKRSLPTSVSFKEPVKKYKAAVHTGGKAKQQDCSWSYTPHPACAGEGDTGFEGGCPPPGVDSCLNQRPPNQQARQHRFSQITMRKLFLY